MRQSELFRKQNEARQVGNHVEAMHLLDDIHKVWHDHPLIHLRVHWYWALIYREQRRYAHYAWQLVAMVFAPPVSLLQRWFGVARKNL